MRWCLALFAVILASGAEAKEPVPVRRLVEHYYPYYFAYVGPLEARGEAPMMSSAGFIAWWQEAGADDPAVQRTLALRNARLEAMSAFDFKFLPLEKATRADRMADLLEKITQASRQYQLHTNVPPGGLNDLLSNPGQEFWKGPYLQAERLKPFFNRFQFLTTEMVLLSRDAGSPPPACATPACISWAWLKMDGIPPLYAQVLDRWLDTAPSPTTGKIRLTATGLMYEVMQTNK